MWVGLDSNPKSFSIVSWPRACYSEITDKLINISGALSSLLSHSWLHLLLTSVCILQIAIWISSTFFKFSHLLLRHTGDRAKSFQAPYFHLCSLQKGLYNILLIFFIHLLNQLMLNTLFWARTRCWGYNNKRMATYPSLWQWDHVSISWWANHPFVLSSSLFLSKTNGLHTPGTWKIQSSQVKIKNKTQKPQP